MALKVALRIFTSSISRGVAKPKPKRTPEARMRASSVSRFFSLIFLLSFTSERVG